MELLLERINLLKKEIESLTASIETNTLSISRLEEANQIRYVDLDKRIHLLETKLLFEETQEQEELVQSINPLSGLVEEEIDSGEFELWSNSMRLLDNSRYSEAAENLRLLILSYPEGSYTGDAYFWLGEISLINNELSQSKDFFMELISLYPNHYRVPLAHKKVGDVYLKTNDINKAKDKYNFVVREYPNNTASSLALQLLKNME